MRLHLQLAVQVQRRAARLVQGSPAKDFSRGRGATGILGDTQVTRERELGYPTDPRYDLGESVLGL